MDFPGAPIVTLPIAELLGPLNEFEQKYAPQNVQTAGRLDLLRHRPRVAVVGSRQATREGLLRARKLASVLVPHHIVVVSGLALGIDTAAHSETIRLGGDTVAVLGTPLDQVNPPSNRDLQARISQEHLAVSQFPLGQAVQRRNFVLRNRTMALVSDATVIVEAGEGSGTISQGWEALRLGRSLFLMRSLVEQGPPWILELLEHGARILTNVEDLLAELPSARRDSQHVPF